MKEYSSYKLSLMPSIVKEARKCFMERGINAVKMDDIAKSLGISKRTLYELYSNKEDLLVEVIKSIKTERNQHLAHFAEDSDNVMDILIEALRMQIADTSRTNVAFYKDMTKYPKAATFLTEHLENMKDSALKFYNTGVKEGYFIDNIDFEVFLKIFSGTMNMIRITTEFKELTYRELFTNYIYVNVRGFCTSKGIVRIDNFVKEIF